MKRFPMYLAAGAAVVALAASAVTAQSGTSTAAPTYTAPRGIAYLQPVFINLPANVWTHLPLQVTLPVAGTYDLDADVRARLSGVSSINSFISARLWNVTTSSAVPMSERLIYQIIDTVPGHLVGGNQTAPINELISVPGPTVIRVQAMRTDASGAASIAQIYSDSYGYTSLRFQEIFP
jgi:hypothetical protein